MVTTTATALLPTVNWGDTEITRLIIGGNQIRGFSHVSPELDDEMREFHTVDNTVESWLHAEACGLNTMQSRGDAIIYERIRAYRERGGTMQWIAQTAGEHPDPYENIREIATYDPIAIYHHGSVSDARWLGGTFDKVQDYLKAIRDTGAMVGIAAHMPEILQHVEDQGWDVDFYMTCFYDVAKAGARGLVAEGAQNVEHFDEEDRDVICEFIRQTEKPCIAYKILGASRKCSSPETIHQAFKFAFDRIKPIDIVNVGMFQKHTDQLAMNADIVRRMA